MKAKIVAALVLSSAMLTPSLSSAQQPSDLQQIFPNRGACESTLKQLRNDARKFVKENGGSGQTNAFINRLANPAVKFICTTITSPDGSTSFQIVDAG